MNTVHSKLEFDIICSRVASLASSTVVAEELKRLEPVTDASTVEKMLTQTGDALIILASHRPDLAFDDSLPLIEKARVGATLSPSELLIIRRGILSLRSLKACVENADGCDSLKDITAWVRACDELERKIDGAIENENELKDSASEKLYSLRRAIVRASAKLKERLDSFTRQNEISKYLQDNIVTIRGGRFVVPVRSEYRSSVKGLVHDVSATGATVFIEPFSVVDANNELCTLRTEELNEIERILRELGVSVVANAAALADGQRVLTECGVIFAKAEYAKKIDAYRPKISQDGKISLLKARHPLISPDTVVPVDIVLDKRILLISGPNTGGKTVVLKTVGLFSIMAACGMFLPTADGSEIPVFSEIYCDVGDAQSITQSLSTFSAHIKNIAAITAEMNADSLVLLDEPGDGTDPEEGAALAIAIIKSILRSGATAVVTTHFNSVKEYALGSGEVSNSCMQFDNVNFKPTYKLLRGVSGSSYALEISENLGLSAEIIADAKSSLSAEKLAFDKVMREAEKLRNDAMSDKAEIERLKRSALENSATAQKLKADYERKLSDLNENSRAIVRRLSDEYEERAEGIISEIKQKLKNADEAALFAARALAKKLGEGVPEDAKKPTSSGAAIDPSELRNGVKVFVSGLNKEGSVVGRVHGDKALVAIGAIKTELPISSLSLVAEAPKARKEKISRDTAEPITREIMLLGYTVDDATLELERIISDVPPRSTLRIVHGKGTGALGKGIQNFLRRQPRIKSFRYGRYGEGDTGVTIAEIK